MSKGRKVPAAPARAVIDYERLGDALCAAFEKTHEQVLGKCLPMAIVGVYWLQVRGVACAVNVGDLDIRVASDALWGFVVERPGDRLYNGDFHAWISLAQPLRVLDPAARYLKDAVLFTPGNRWERADLPRTWIGDYGAMQRDGMWYRADPDLTRRAILVSTDTVDRRASIHTLADLTSLHYDNPDVEILVYDTGPT